MMFAVRKLQGIGLIMLLTMCTLVAYPISLRVAATRAELQQIEREIAETRQHNRMLEGDIAVLANVHQLDRWNTEFFGYAPPSAAQYLPGERALANLDSMQPVRSGAPSQPVLAALSAPSAASEPRPAPSRDARNADASVQGTPQLAMVDRRTVANSVVHDIRRSMPTDGIASSATAPLRGGVR